MNKKEKTINIIFLIIVAIIVIIPLIFVKKDNSIEKAIGENRNLKQRPSIINEEKKLNKTYLKELELWFNDNFGFRNFFIKQYAKLEYIIFDRIIDERYCIGKNGELIYVTPEIILDYQHLNLRTDEADTKIAESVLKIQTWLEKQNIQFYYMQCYDKQSIYPEEFMEYVKSNGELSKTDKMINIMEEQDVNVISLKESLLIEKEQNRVFGTWYDPTHWNYRGAYIGYLKLMEIINDNNNNKYDILQEEDYNIYKKDKGTRVSTVIHKEDLLQIYEVKNINAKIKKDKNNLGYYVSDSRNCLYINEECNNRDVLLIIGDSYVGSYIIDDIAESFYKTYLIWTNHLNDINNMVKTFNPDIVVLETVERCDISKIIINTAKNMKEN